MTQSLINTKVLPFNATAFKNGEFVEVSEKDIEGKWAIFMFYPADFTFVCPTELGDLADHYKKLQELGVDVYSVSTDTHFTGKITRNFGVMIEEDGLALRGTFVVNPEGEIKIAEIHDLGIGRSASELLRKVQAAQYVANHDGEVCPAAWQPGEETLTPSLDLVGKI